MTDYQKAERIIAYIAKIVRRGAYLEVEDILSRVSSRKELDFYYRWCRKELGR